MALVLDFSTKLVNAQLFISVLPSHSNEMLLRVVASFSILLMNKNFWLIQASHRQVIPTTFSTNHNVDLWNLGLYPGPAPKDAEEDSNAALVKNGSTKFNIIIDALSEMIDQLQVALIAIDDRMLELIGEIVGKLSPSQLTRPDDRELETRSRNKTKPIL